MFTKFENSEMTLCGCFFHTKHKLESKVAAYGGRGTLI